MKRLLALVILASLFIPMLTPLTSFAEEEFSYTEQDVIDTNLPVIYLKLDNDETITDRENWKSGVMRIRNTDDYSACTNLYTEIGGRIQLKGRGNSTWWQFSTQKRAYSLKLDQKTSLFGMDASKNWTLLANFMDRSNLRNKFAYDLSGRLGLEFSDSTFVNVYLNGNYQGVYQLCEKPAAPIDEWDELGENLAEAIICRHKLEGNNAQKLLDAAKNDLSWMTKEKWNGYTVSDYIDLSARDYLGNYLFEYDYYYDEPSKFTTHAGVPLNIRSPEALHTNQEAMKRLQNYIQQFENALVSDNFINSQGYHYSDYVDMQSLVDYYIVNALIKNVEFGYKSMYFYLDEYGILHMGPCWDYDWSSGNHFLGAAPNPEAWYDDWRASTNTWYHELYGDPYFVSLVQERWFQVLPIIEDEIERLALWENYLSAASDLEREVYLSLPNEHDYRRQSGDYSFADEVEEFRQFLQKRVEWMNKQFDKSSPNIEGAGGKDNANFDLTLYDSDGEVDFCNDSDFPIDYVTDGENDLLIGANTSVTFYLNGKLLAENTDSFQFSHELMRSGVNVMIARSTVNGELRQDILRFQTPASAPTFVEIGRDTIALSPPQRIVYVEQPPAPVSVKYYLWEAAIASSCVLIAGGAVSMWILLRKRKSI